jgi:hypothetical protein
MGDDKNSIQEFGLWTRFHSCTSASFSCQVHVATEVLVNLVARTNQQPQHTRSGNTHDTAASCPNRSGQFLKPVRLLLLDLASRRQGKPVRPVWQIGPTDFVQNLPKDPKPPQETFHIRTKEAIAQQRLPCSKILHDSPQGETGQTGLGNRSGRFLPGQSGWTQPPGKTQHTLQSISRFVPRIKVRLWGSMGYLVGYPWLEARSPKLTQSRGIESQPSQTPLTLELRNHRNRAP